MCTRRTRASKKKRTRVGFGKKKKKVLLTSSSSLICLADYAEELRFYLIHMTEVRESVFMCVFEKEKLAKTQSTKEGVTRTAHLVCEPEGAIGSAGNHITGKKD